MSEDQLQPSDTLDDRGVDDVLDEGYSPPEREPDHLRHPHEVDEPETLDERLAEEEPDVRVGVDDESDDVLDDGEVGDARSGRLVAQDEGSADDEDSQLWASDRGIDGAGASAEEAAMHVIDDDE
jgi:ABC-type Fe3+-citrate transport system substrate-binding protein